MDPVPAPLDPALELAQRDDLVLGEAAFVGVGVQGVRIDPDQQHRLRRAGQRRLQQHRGGIGRARRVGPGEARLQPNGQQQQRGHGIDQGERVRRAGDQGGPLGRDVGIQRGELGGHGGQSRIDPGQRRFGGRDRPRVAAGAGRVEGAAHRPPLGAQLAQLILGVPVRHPGLGDVPAEVGRGHGGPVGSRSLPCRKSRNGRCNRIPARASARPSQTRAAAGSGIRPPSATEAAVSPRATCPEPEAAT